MKTSTFTAAAMLSRHATPNTTTAAITGMTRFCGFQYCTPSSTPETTVARNAITRLTRSTPEPATRREPAELTRPMASSRFAASPNLVHGHAVAGAGSPQDAPGRPPAGDGADQPVAATTREERPP